MGIIISSRDQDLYVSRPKDPKAKEKKQKKSKLNLKLLILKLKTSSMMSLPTQGRTKEKGTMARKNSSVFIVGRASTLNMTG